MKITKRKINKKTPMISSFMGNRSLGKNRSLFNRHGILLILCMGVVGSAALISTYAAGPSLSLEPEQGVLTGDVTIGTDPNASAGGYVMFGTSQSANIAPPTNLKVASVTYQQVNLSWDPSTSPTVNQYQIIRNGNVLATVSFSSTFGDVTVAPSQTYTYAVKALDSSGNSSAPTTTVNATTPSAPINTALQLWSDPNTWGGTTPKANDTVTIAAGSRILLDIDTPKFNGIVVNGHLEIKDRPTVIDTSYIDVMGEFVAGTDAVPLASNITIKLDGQPTDTRPAGATETGANAFMGMGTGKIELHGKDVGATWTKLASTANVGATSITLVDPVSWPVGSVLSIAPSGYDLNEVDRVTVQSVSPDKKTITFSTPLKYRHASVVTSKTFNGETRSVAVQSEVGLLTHNLKITGPDNAPQTKFGGHVMVMDQADLRISNVELYHMGQMGILKRYPLHWHFRGDAGASLISRVSIYDSYNRFLSIHETDNLHVDGMVGDDTFGHGIMLEDGVEKNNVLTNNLVMRVHRPPDNANIAATKAAFPNVPICPTTNPTVFFSNDPSKGKPANASCRILTSDDVPAGFWITNPSNTFSNNSSAGSDGIGIWYDFSFNSDNKCLENDIQGGTLVPASMASRCGNGLALQPFGPFINATAHTTKYPCSDSSSAEAQSVCGNNLGSDPSFTTHCASTGFCTEEYIGNPANRGIINNPTAWMNANEGLWLDGAATITNPMIAENATGMTNQSSYVKGGMIIGNGTGASLDHKVPFGLLRYYHGQSDTDDVWMGGFATYADSPEGPNPMAAITDSNGSAFDGNNRVRNIKFFENWPNYNNAQVLANNRVGFGNNGCYAIDAGGIDHMGTDHWVTDVDGSVKGDGVPATITNNLPMMRPLNGTDNVGDNKGNTTCNKTLTLNGGVFQRSGGQTILFPNVNVSNSYWSNDNGFYSPGVRNFFKGVYFPGITKYVRLNDNMTGFPDAHEIAVFDAAGYRYELQNSGNTNMSSFNADLETYNTGKITFVVKWNPTTAKVSFAGHSMSAAASLTGLDTSTSSSYFLDNTNKKLYIHIVITGTDAAFGDPDNLSGLRFNGFGIEYLSGISATQ
jgi:hypothetical protein